ncbi:MAG: hypothetical protein V1685_05515 [Parcubacteria group bacterium]
MNAYRAVKIVINPAELEADVRRVLKAVAVTEMGWPALDLIENVVNGQTVQAVDFVALRDDEVLGVTKVLMDRPFPVEFVFPEISEKIDDQRQHGKVVEVALTGVAKQHRGDLSVMLSIYRALYHWSRREGVGTWFSIQERQVTRLYNRLAMPFVEIASGKFYWCGMSYPCMMSLANGEAIVQKRNPAFWAFLQEEPKE